MAKHGIDMVLSADILITNKIGKIQTMMTVLASRKPNQHDNALLYFFVNTFPTSLNLNIFLNFVYCSSTTNNHTNKTIKSLPKLFKYHFKLLINFHIKTILMREMLHARNKAKQ
jgi:hypothetical protein